MKKSILIILGALILMIAVGGFIFIKCDNEMIFPVPIKTLLLLLKRIRLHLLYMVMI